MAALSALEPTWPMDPSRLCRDSARRYLRDRNCLGSTGRCNTGLVERA